MAKTMKAAVVHEFGKPLKIEEVPIPEPGPGEVLIKVIANGVCHTDLHAANGDWPAKPVPPFIPGHEGTGIVAALGPSVTRLRDGDPVGLAWLHDACGECEYCRTGVAGSSIERRVRVFDSHRIRRGMGAAKATGWSGAFRGAATRYPAGRSRRLPL